MTAIEPQNEEYTFAQLLKGREDEFPTLARAAANTQLAVRETIEWKAGDAIWRNHTQIMRSPYNGDRKDETLTAFLRDIDRTLEHGEPSETKHSSGFYLRTCGGYRHYLGRDLNDGDVLSLRPVMHREVKHHSRYWQFEKNEPLDPPIHEWMSEFSLAVTPGTLVAA